MPEETQLVKVGRLAFRVEGDFWNGYWAPQQTTMEGAVLLGSIRLLAVKATDGADARKEQSHLSRRDKYALGGYYV